MKNTLSLLLCMLCIANITGQTSDEVLLKLKELEKHTQNLTTKLKKVNKKTLLPKKELRNGISITGGYSENGYGVMSNFQYYPDKGIDRHFEIGGYAGFIEEKKTGYNIPIEVYTLNIGYFIGIPFLSSKNDAFRFSIGAGGTIGNESINDSKIQLTALESISTEDGVIYGAYGALGTDIKITKKLSGIIRYTHFHHPNSEVGKTKFMIGIGINFKL